MTRSKTAESLVSALVILLIMVVLILAHGDRPAGDGRPGASAPDADAARTVPVSSGPAETRDLGPGIEGVVGAS